MVKRAACALLWLIAVGWAFNFISAYAGVPQVIGTVLAVAVASFIGIDPLHVVWPVSARASSSGGRDAASAVGRVASRI